jgi:hypothetical protein
MKSTRQEILAAVRDSRRQRVAELLCKGYTRSQISTMISEDPEFFNPDTGQPWGRNAVYEDSRYLRSKWQKAALANYDVHVSRVLAQIREVRRQAWKQMDFKTILRTLDQEVKLLGLDKATKSEIDWREEMRKAGVSDPSQEFETLVQEAYQRMLTEQEK